MSNSKPAINMMYNKPIVENNSTAEFLAKIFKPCGPIKVPETIKPIIPGILILRSRIGESKMIKSMVENIRTGFFNGKSNSFKR